MATTDRPVWAADVPISLPIAPAESVLVPMYGFGMTEFRLVHDISAAEREMLSRPTYAPDDPGMPTVRDDTGVENLDREW